jgi:hypothetical protein
MKDCPRCEAPLHDHEAICPRCGEKQYVKKGLTGSSLFEDKSTMNPVPMIVIIVLIVVGLGFAASQSWIGQMMTRGPVKADPMDSITPVVARQLIEEKITANLAAVNAKGTFDWKEGDQKADRNSPILKSVTLDIETQLKDPKGQHEMIVNPIKPLMDRGNVTTITLNDTKAHATWTYSLAPPAAAPDATTDGAPPDQ